MKHRHFIMTALFGLMFLFLSYSSFVYSASFEVVDDLWVSDRTGIGTTAPFGLLQVGTLPTTPGLIVTTGNNVGIGTTNPAVALEISGQAKITGGSPAANRILTSDANGLANWQTPNGGGWSDDGATVRLSTDTDNVGIGLTNPGAKLHLSGAGTTTGFTFRIADTTPTDRLVVQDSGNLGLGTTAPVALLQVGTTPTPGLLVTAAGRVGIGNTSPLHLLQVGTSPNAGLIVQVNGNVGIGTTNAGFALDVRGVRFNFKTTTDSATAFTVRQASGNSTLTVDTLNNDVISGGTISSGNRIRSIDGAINDPSYTFSNDGDTGMFCPSCGTDQLAFTTGGKERMRIDGSGNIGIGITLPTAAIHIIGAGTTASFGLRVADSLATDRMVVQDRGNVGIGTTVPYGLLQVGTLPTTPAIIATTADNVGIATTNPKAKLEIIPADTSSGFYLNLAEAKIIMKSPDGTCSACGPNNSDAWSCASVACP